MMAQEPSKIQGKFYPLTPEMGQKLREANLTAAEWRLWSYLVEIDPFGDRYLDLPDTLTVMQVCGMKKTTFYTAIAKFQALELFDFQDKGFSVRNLTFPKNRKVVRENGNPSEKSETLPKNRKVVRENGNFSEKSENQPLKPASKAYSGSSQTIQTYSDFIQTLSNSEREKFFEFVREKIKDFDPPINDLEGWLAGQNQAGHERWRLYYEMFQKELKQEESAQSDWESHPKYWEWIEALRAYPGAFDKVDEVDGRDLDGNGKLWIFGTRESRPERKAFKAWAQANQKIWGEESC